MSTILKALRRLEEDKASAAGGRPLREEVATAAPASTQPPGRRLLPAAVAGVALLAVAATAWTLWPRGAEPARQDVAAEPVAAPPVPLARPATPDRPVAGTPAAAPERLVAPTPPAAQREVVPAPAATRREAPQLDEGLPENAFASPVELIRRKVAEPREPMALARASDPLPAPGDAPAPPQPVSRRASIEPGSEPPGVRVARAREEADARRARIAAASETAPIARTPEPAPAPEVEARTPPQSAPELEARTPAPAPGVEAHTPPAPAPQVLARAEETAPSARKTASPARVDAAESAVVASSAPLPRVQKTQWHPLPDRRVAFVALGGDAVESVHEGDVVGRYLVSEIQPSGVVFLDDGKPVQRKIGED